MAPMTQEQAQELLIKLEGLLGALHGIEKAIDRLAVATEKEPPSSKRGGK